MGRSVSLRAGARRAGVRRAGASPAPTILRLALAFVYSPGEQARAFRASPLRGEKGQVVSLWQISENTFDPKKLHSRETVYTIGNGYFGTRGTFEEGYPRANPATLLFGVFDDIPIGKEELANAPDWVPIKLFVNDERFRLDKGKILDYQRTLDMQNGVLSRTVRWESPSGIRLSINSERFASLADEHVGAIR